MTEAPRKSFAEMRKELAEKRGRSLDETPSERHLKSVPGIDSDLVPDVLPERSEEDDQIDGIIRSIDVLDAYRRWIGKEVDESTTSRPEGVMVSCPLPGHRDAHPSAWLNTDKNTWFCGGCQEGGDVYDLAAIKFGYSRPDYKSGKAFHDLRKEMAESYGWQFKTVAGVEIAWQEPEAQSADNAPLEAASSEVSSAPAESDEPKVTYLRDEDVEDEVEEDIFYPVLDWHSIVKEGTFLDEYLKATANDDSPEEYHFWHGMLALGHAVGRKAFLNDTRPVYSNLLVCLLGGTGYGKSRSRAWLDDVIEEALPYRDNGLDTTGCKLVPVPASGENLIMHFQHVAHDPSFPKGTPEIRTPVNGIVDYDEFAGLLHRANRQGATLRQIIMGFSDSRPRISPSSNTGGTFEAYQPFCSITASTQPKAVRPLLSRTDTSSGFLNRWIFVGGPRKKREVMGGVHSSIRVNLKPSIEALKKVRAWGSVERDIRFTEDGFDKFEELMRKHVFPIQQNDTTDLLTRLDLTMKRMVLLFCINEHKLEADEEIVSKLQPIMTYMIECYGILNAEIGITAMSEITAEILRHIERIQVATGQGATARDLGLRMKRKNYPPDLVKRALETMVALDWIDQVKTKGAGRPSIRYKVVS